MRRVSPSGARSRFLSHLALPLVALLWLASACGGPAAPPAGSSSAAFSVSSSAASSAASRPSSASSSASASSAASTAASGSAAGGPTLIVAFDQSDAKGLDPARGFEQFAYVVNMQTYDRLVAHKSAEDINTFVPVLAKEWKVTPDGKEYTFTLRNDVKFPSGNPFTAEDVKFSLMRIKNIKDNPSWMMDPLKEVQVVDKYTVKMIMNDSFADWLAVLAGEPASILDSKLVKENGGTDSTTADKDDKASEWLNQHSAGSGPFILKSWQKNNVVILERNPNYFLGPAKLARVEIRDVPSPATQKLQVENGDADVALNLTPDLVAAVKNNPNVKVITGQSVDNLYMGMTCDPKIDPNLAKKEVRQAIRAAIDYDGVLALTNNTAVRSPAVYSIGVLGMTKEDADRMNPKYDPAKAKQLLAAAGLPNGFSFKLEYGTGPSPVGVTYESVAQKVQADLKKVGITMELIPEEFMVMLTKYRQKDRSAVISYNVPDYLGASDWADQMITGTWAPRLHYDSKQAIDLTHKADAELDPAKRAKLYQQIIELLVDEGPYVELVQGQYPIALRPNVKGWAYFPIGAVKLYDVSKG